MTRDEIIAELDAIDAGVTEAKGSDSQIAIARHGQELHTRLHRLAKSFPSPDSDPELAAKAKAVTGRLLHEVFGVDLEPAAIDSSYRDAVTPPGEDQ